MVNLQKVLIVDDEQDNLDLVRERLQGLYQVFTASDGEQGWAVVLKFKPDIILLDIRMPRMDGVEFLKRLRSMPETREISVIMMTAVGETNSILAMEELGVEDYLIKPIHLQDLPSFLKKHLY